MKPLHMGPTLLLLSFFLLLFGGCGASDPPIPDDGLTIHNPYDGLWQDRAEVPIRFELEQTFGAEEEPVEAALSSVIDIATDDENNLYVLDGRDASRILSFAPDGTLRWTVETNGEGPGELNEPLGIVWNERDSLLLLNQSGLRIDYLSKDGRFGRSRRLQADRFWRPDLLGFIPPDKILLSSAQGWLKSSTRFVRVGDEVEWLTTLEEDQGDGRKAIGFYFGVPVYAFRGMAATAQFDAYQLTLHDTTGALRRVVRRDMHDLMRPGQYESPSGARGGLLGRMRAPLALNDGYWIVSSFWPTNVDDPDEWMRRGMAGEQHRVEYANSIDLYDEKDRLLYVLSGEGPAPEIGNPVHTDAHARLYTVLTEPYPRIARYRVIIDE